MKKSAVYIFALIQIIILSSCEQKTIETISMGTISYHPKFLWSKADTTFLSKTLYLDFSNDAKGSQNSFAEFEFVDNEGKSISSDILEIYINNEKSFNNRFRVNSTDEIYELKFRFMPETNGGKKQGYLKLIDHNIDRLDNLLLTAGQQVEVLQWTMYFDKQMNPLKKNLMWGVLTIVALLIIWFILFRPILYPKFSTYKKQIIIQQNGKVLSQNRIVFTGARQVVFANRKMPQSLMNRIFTGKIVTIVNPVFVTPLTFSPQKGKNAIVRGNGYITTPNPIPRNGLATIKQAQQLLQINLN